MFEHDWLWRRDPAQAAVGDRAIRLTDVLTDRDEFVVADHQVTEAELAPHLAKAGVDVEKNAARGPAQDLAVVEKAHDIEQELAARQPLPQLRTREPDLLLAAVAEQCE